MISPIETDLKYEGIATHDCPPFDLLIALYTSKQTWNTKGLRPTLCCFIEIWPFIETDLKYEGIATDMSYTELPKYPKGIETDLKYEGIATSACYRSNPISLIIETDLKYEGIATKSIRLS